MASKIGKPLLADSATIQKMKLAAPRILVELHQTEEVIPEIKMRGRGTQIIQKVEYEWHPTPCAVLDKWGHLTKDCDPY